MFLFCHSPTVTLKNHAGASGEGTAPFLICDPCWSSYLSFFPYVLWKVYKPIGRIPCLSCPELSSDKLSILGAFHCNWFVADWVQLQQWVKPREYAVLIWKNVSDTSFSQRDAAISNPIRPICVLTVTFLVAKVRQESPYFISRFSILYYWKQLGYNM